MHRDKDCIERRDDLFAMRDIQFDNLVRSSRLVDQDKVIGN